MGAIEEDNSGGSDDLLGLGYIDRVVRWVLHRQLKA